MSDLVRLNDNASDGDRYTAAQLMPLVYNELRGLAAARLGHEAPSQTLDATALVHEAYVRLVGAEDEGRWENRGHFFSAAAQAMRRILVDAARRKATVRHGGQYRRLQLDELPGLADSPGGLIDLNDALERFAAVEPRKARLVELRFFGGQSVDQAAELLEISPATAARWWEFARVWLYAELRA